MNIPAVYESGEGIDVDIVAFVVDVGTNQLMVNFAEHFVEEPEIMIR